jgi:hypothetical protein
LRQWRSQKAKELGVWAFLVLRSSVLAEIARRRPRTLVELEWVIGIGARKIEQFGQELIDVVKGCPPPPKPEAAAKSVEVGLNEATQSKPSPPNQAVTELPPGLRLQIELFRQGGPEPDTADLMTVLQQAETHTSKEVILTINTLSALGVQQTNPWLLKLLDSDNGNVLTSAAEALGKLGAHEAIPRLTQLLADERPTVQRAAVRALGRLRANEALERLQRIAADDESDYVRVAAQAAVMLIRSNS